MSSIMLQVLNALGYVAFTLLVTVVCLYGMAGLFGLFLAKPKKQAHLTRYCSSPLDTSRLVDLRDYYVYWLRPDGKEICAICEWFADTKEFKMWDPLRNGNDVTIVVPQVTAVYALKIADEPLIARRAL